MQIIIDSQGNGRCIYDETIPLVELGRIKIRRGSHVEPLSRRSLGGQLVTGWRADLGTVRFSISGPDSRASLAGKTLAQQRVTLAAANLKIQLFTYARLRIRAGGLFYGALK